MNDNLLLKIHLWLITALIGVVGFFVKDWMKQRETKEKDLEANYENLENTVSRCKEELSLKSDAIKEELSRKADAMFTSAVDKFSDAADRLDRTVNGLETIVQVIKQQNVEFARRMEEKEKWLDDHDKEINDISHRLHAMEATLKIRQRS